MSAEEDARWVERSGWAPRFGQGDSISGDQADGLDHQTWLEGKLEDKFFGGMALNGRTPSLYWLLLMPE